MLLKIVLCLLLILLMFPLGRCFLNIDNKFCFNAQIQDAHLILVDGKEVVKSIRITTINDTTAVKHRFHVDYIHPESKIWTSYQEDRRTMLFTLPPAKTSSLYRLTDRIVTKSLRASLKKSSAATWLGEICMKIFLYYEKRWKREKKSCEKGFYGDGKFCIDINECADNTGNFCPAQQHCIDYPGKYSCPNTCRGDKLLNKRTGSCEDPCYQKGYLCHPKARCLYGKCVCNSGYEGDGSYCLDSCVAKGLVCDPNAMCADGKCKCRDGYQGNGEICQAICHFNLKLCHPNAVCYLNACKCKKGYVGDGISECMFSRILYEKQLKKKNAVEARMDIVESDVAEIYKECLLPCNYRAGYDTVGSTCI